MKKEFCVKCKNCGKEFTVIEEETKFPIKGDKYFCCKSCANVRHHSNETKQKISNSIKKSEKYKINNEKALINRIIKYNQCSYKYNLNIKQYTCKYCGKLFEITDNKNYSSKTYCSKECKHKYLSEHTGGYRIGSGHSKSGWYKGIRCDSTWELAFLIYHLDNNLYIERCKEKRKYIFEGKEHIYYPDFITDKGIIEIKGYKTNQSIEKQKQNPDIINIFEEDIQFYLNYIKEKYNKSLIELYDNSKPKLDFLNNVKYIWMHNDELQKNTMIYPEKYEEYTNNGWKHGRKKYKI